MAAIPSTQRAAVVSGYGGPAGLSQYLKVVTDKPVPTAGAGQVLVRMRVRPVNPADGLSAMGLYPGFAPASSLPATLGLDGMGEVAALGDGVSEFKVGQRVVPLFVLGYAQKGEGSWQEYVAVSSQHLVPVPEGVSDEAAAQLVVNPATVVGLLKELSVPTGEYLLQTQAGGAVGTQMITLCKAKGIRTINVVRRREAFQELKALGADEVVCSSDEDVAARVMEITGGKGAYAAVESVAGELTGKVVAAVRPGGTVLILGGASGIAFSASIADFIFRGVTLKGFWLSLFLNISDDQERQALFEEIFGYIKSGQMQVSCGKSYDLSEFASALKAQQQVGRQGKILLVG